MPADYTHAAISPGATLDATKWNGDHENHITNRSALTLPGAGSTVTALKETFAVGDVGSENLPQNVKEDIQSLRDQIKTMKQTAQWYETNSASTEYIWTQGWYTSLSGSTVHGLAASGSTYAYWFTWFVPPDYISGDITATLYMAGRGGSGGVADLRGTLYAGVVSETDVSNQTVGTTELIFTATLTLAAASVPAVGSQLLGYISRYADDASDTSTAIVQIIGVRIGYTGKAGGAKR